MKTTAFILSATAAMTCGMLHGQNAVYQQAGAISVTTGGAIGSGFGIVSADILGARVLTGSPFSATEQRHSLQVLGDGTRIERNDTTQISRDNQGRTRSELPAGPDGRSMVTIQDPVAGMRYMLDPVQKTANKIPMPKSIGAIPMPSDVAMSARVTKVGAGPQIVTLEARSVEKSGGAPEAEDLGTQNIDGVLAKGTRTTINIPAGQIGNDRALQVVSERWYSEDLQEVVKSSNSDPRFGTTTYELTNISRTEPDPTLFQVPADYTVTDQKAFFKTLQTQ